MKNIFKSNGSQTAKSLLGGLGVKTILFALAILFLLASCTGKNKQSQQDSSQNETQAVDTNKIYDMSEVDTPPVMP